MQLSQGAITRILASDGNQAGAPPSRLQVMDIKKIVSSSNSGQERFRILLSDGDHVTQFMLAAQMNQAVLENKLQNRCIVDLEDYFSSIVNNSKLFIILKATVVSSPQPPIGAPKPALAPQVGQQAGNTSVSAAPPQNNNYYGGAQAPVNPSNPSTGHRGPVARATEHKTHPVAALNPFLQNWLIKVRVTNKSDIRKWSNQKGEGQLFSIDLLDEQGTEIRATFFRDAVDKFYDVIQQNKVYYMGGGRLKAANRRFTSIKNEYEITFDARATVEACPDDTKIDTQHFNFVDISKFEAMVPGVTVDVIGVATNVSEIATIQTKAGREVEKRDLTIVDRSRADITVTLWGNHAHTPTDQLYHAVIAIKGAKLGDFSGRSLSSLPGSTVEVNPDIPVAHDLKGWFESEGAQTATHSLSDRSGGNGGGGGSGPISNVELRKTLTSIKDENLGMGDRPDYITVKATITNIFRNTDSPPWYAADPTESADGKKQYKKVVEDPSRNVWINEHTGQTITTPAWRYIMRVALSDSTGSQIVTLFDEHAAELLGKSASEMRELLQTSQQTAASLGGDASQAAAPAPWDAVFQEANFSTWMFTLRVKSEMSQDEQRIRVSVARMRSVDSERESRTLLSAIEKFSM